MEIYSFTVYWIVLYSGTVLYIGHIEPSPKREIKYDSTTIISDGLIRIKKVFPSREFPTPRLFGSSDPEPGT